MKCSNEVNDNMCYGIISMMMKDMACVLDTIMVYEMNVMDVWSPRDYPEMSDSYWQVAYAGINGLPPDRARPLMRREECTTSRVLLMVEGPVSKTLGYQRSPSKAAILTD